MDKKEAGVIRISIGDSFPKFELEAYPGLNRLRDSDLRGSWAIVYFYPKDGTHGCTKEALNFRDDKEMLAAMGARIVGVSTDSIRSHVKFHKKYALNFELLSDPDGALGEKVGVLRGSLFKRMERVTFILDPDGRVARIYPKVKYLGHSKKVMEDLRGLKADWPRAPRA